MRSITTCTLSAAIVILLAGCTEKTSSTPAPPAAPAPAAAPPPAPAPAQGAPAVVIPGARIELGRNAYKVGACAMCHGADAKGGAGGPNLTTGVWAHGDGSVASILAVIEKGVPKGDIKNASYPLAMPPAAMYLPNADERLALAEYLWSLANPAKD